MIMFALHMNTIFVYQSLKSVNLLILSHNPEIFHGRCGIDILLTIMPYARNFIYFNLFSLILPGLNHTLMVTLMDIPRNRTQPKFSRKINLPRFK